MKRPTIESLQKEIAALNARVVSAQAAEQTWKSNHYDTLRETGGEQVAAMLAEAFPDLRVGPVELEERALQPGV